MFCYVILFNCKWCYLLVVTRVKKVISITHYWLPGCWEFHISAKPRITSYVMQELIWWESKFSLRKIPSFHLNSWCGNFAERPSFHIGLGNSPETMQKLCSSTKRAHQEIRWNGGIFRSVLKWPTVCLINFCCYYCYTHKLSGLYVEASSFQVLLSRVVFTTLSNICDKAFF